jgi:CheY-like chemotaxis protein
MLRGADNASIERLNEIESAARDAGKLAQQVLAFARGDKCRPRVISLSRVADEAVEQLKRAHPSARILTREFKPSIWNAEVDASQLTEAICNILLNAFEATSDGGEIHVRTENVVVDDAMAASTPGLDVANYIRLTVEDTGDGMSPETLDRVYEPYFSTKNGGRWLGMAAVYGIAKNHLSAIHGESELGKGTRFDLYLPATMAEANEEPIPVPLEEERGTETVLIVEDEAMVAAINQAVFEHRGYTVLLASNGREAVDIARERSAEIDVVLLDMAMPVMGGAEAFPLLRSARPALKVILCSGYDLDESAQSLINAGASAFIQKPFGLEELCLEIRKTLDS